MADDATPFDRDAAFDLLWPVLKHTHPDLPARVALADFCNRHGIVWARVFPGAPKRNRAYAFAQTVCRMVSYVRRMLPYAAAATFFIQEADSRTRGVPGLVVGRLIARFRGMYPLQSVDREDEDAIAVLVERLVRERLAWLGDGRAESPWSSDDESIPDTDSDGSFPHDRYNAWFERLGRRLRERWADSAETLGGWRDGFAVGVRADRARLLLEGRGFAGLDALRRDARALRDANVQWADRVMRPGERWTIDQPETILLFMDEIRDEWRPHFPWLLQRYPALKPRTMTWSLERLEMLARMGDALAGGMRVPFAQRVVVVRRDDGPLRLETDARELPIPLEGDGDEYFTFPMPAEMEQEVAESLEDRRLPAYGGDAPDHMVRAGSRFWPKAIHACGRRGLRLFAPLRGEEAPSWSLAPEFAARVAGDLREMARRVGGGDGHHW